MIGVGFWVAAFTLKRQRLFCVISSRIFGIEHTQKRSVVRYWTIIVASASSSYEPQTLNAREENKAWSVTSSRVNPDLNAWVDGALTDMKFRTTAAHAKKSLSEIWMLDTNVAIVWTLVKHPPHVLLIGKWTNEIREHMKVRAPNDKHIQTI